jgi:hypothetical protein
MSCPDVLTPSLKVVDGEGLEPSGALGALRTCAANPCPPRNTKAAPKGAAFFVKRLRCGVSASAAQTPP